MFLKLADINGFMVNLLKLYASSWNKSHEAGSFLLHYYYFFPRVLAACDYTLELWIQVEKKPSKVETI